jgi:hypothetical protein
MFRWIPAIVLAAAGLAFAGCGGDASDTTTTSTPTQPSSTQAASASTLQGTFRMESTLEELEESPLLMDAGEINDGNWGIGTLVFDDSAVSWEVRNDVQEGSTRGTFTTEDDLLTLSFTSGANAGETFVMRYALAGDTLTLTRDPDWQDNQRIVPTPLVLKPWTRVS